MREYTKKPENQSRTLDSNPRASRQAPISDILQAYKNGTLGKQPIQRESVEDEDLLQTKRSGQAATSVILQRYKESIQKYAPEEDEDLLQSKFDTAQREKIDEDDLLQGKFDSVLPVEQELIQQEEKPNNTGLPDNLKTGIENLSGYSMDDVQVYYNSAKPAQLQALAYAQGTDIHIAPGQEKHLPHEAWHVVQQKQGRVQPTMQMQGWNVNDNEGLEKEADVMGDRAKQGNVYYKNVLQYPTLPYCDICLQKRNPNPYVPTVNTKIGGWDQTAHHIIPLNLLEKLYGLLGDEDKCKINEISSKAGEDYQWPKSNLFYGPNTSIRAEPGKKEDFDYDAKYFIRPDIYITLLKHYNILSKVSKKDIFNALFNFYNDIKDEQICQYVEGKWIELKTEDDIEKVKGMREHIVDYSFFKIKQMSDSQTTHPELSKITKNGGDYYFENNKITGEFKGTWFYIKRKNKPDRLEAYLLENMVESSTFLPRKIVDNVNIARELFSKDQEQSLNNKFDKISISIKKNISSLKKSSSKIEKPVYRQLSGRYDFLRKKNEDQLENKKIDIPQIKPDYLNIAEKEISNLDNVRKLTYNNKLLIQDQGKILKELKNISEVEINRGNLKASFSPEKKDSLKRKFNEIKNDLNGYIYENNQIEGELNEMHLFICNVIRNRL